ncbi:MAG: ATP-binding cassette domain-containing protein [Deltaproteobacteria bacterium]|nr:ATP-binding cassette domain-containing protein [Deltaproteobacteria bacterium]
MSAPLLTLANFRVAFGSQLVLADVSLTVARQGMTVLVGPAGSGKSTLLRTLAGLNSAQPALVVGGQALFEGASLMAEPRPPIAYVMQKARFFVESVRENLASALPRRHELDRAGQRERVTGLLFANGLAELASNLDREVVTLPLGVQRRLAVAREVTCDPKLLLVDEPTAGLEEVDAEPLVELLRRHASERAVLVVTHNQAHARALGGTAALLAEGRIQEVSPTQAFFAAPWSAAGRVFVRTGGYSAPALDEDSARPISSATPVIQARPSTANPPVPSFYGPRGFYWVHQGRLGGLPRPGIVASLDDDLRGLQRLGVTRLVTLEETATVPVEALRGHGVRSVHFPIADMGVPDVMAALELCGAIEDALRAGEVVAFHCRAGMGRTGTLLACQLIFEGVSACLALETVRQINPRCIQSQEQADFLARFERAREARVVTPLANPLVTAPDTGRNPQS